MLPKEIQEKAKKIAPSACWRLPDIHSFLGQLSVITSRAQALNDFAKWKKAEDLGNSIMEWIEADKGRLEFYQDYCKRQNEKSLFR